MNIGVRQTQELDLASLNIFTKFGQNILYGLEFLPDLLTDMRKKMWTSAKPHSSENDICQFFRLDLVIEVITFGC